MKGIIIVLVFLATAQNVYASKFVISAPACYSKEDYTELLDYIKKKDDVGLNRLQASKRCFMIRRGIAVDVLESWYEGVKVRTYSVDGVFDVWTVRSAIGY